MKSASNRNRGRSAEELEPLRNASENINTPAEGGAWWHESVSSKNRGDSSAKTRSALAYAAAEDGHITSSHDVPPRTLCDLVSFIFFVLLTSAALIAGGISLGSGAYWVHALKGRPMADCMIIMLSAALPLALGCFIVVLVTGIIVVSTCFCIMPQASLSGVRGRCAKAVRVLFLHVIPFVCLVLGVAGSIAALYFSTMARSQPDLGKDFSHVEGLDGPIVITRDVNGLVHIKANSRGDALFGQGLVHGQDRLWQVEFQRLVGRGRLSEFVGSAGTKMDKQIRTLNFPEGARRMCSNASPEGRALTDRYIAGLNFYVDRYSERPAEFLVMGRRLLKIHEVERFERMDSCLIAMLLMWQTGANIPIEVQRFKVFWNTDRSFDEVNELYPNFTNISSTILSAADLGLTEEDAVAARAREAEDNAIERELYDGHMSALREKYNPGRPRRASLSSGGQHAMSAQGLVERERESSASAFASPESCYSAAAGGDEPVTFSSFARRSSFNLFDLNVLHASNAWAARAPSSAFSPDAAGSQPAIGASDPHLGINVPSVWHWTHMTFPTETGEMYDAAGVGLPGLPGVHIAKTTHTSWGITMSMTDLGDLFLITPDPARPSTHYMVNGESLPFTHRTEVISVKGSGSDVTLTIPETIYGPIATEALGLPQPLLFAVRTDFLINDTTSLDGLMCLNDPLTVTAMDVRDKCLSRIRSPGFSIPIADKQGNIAYSMTGVHPHRAKGHTGRFPTLGNGSFDYRGFIPHTELPTVTITKAQSDVRGGHVSAANQKTYPDGFKYSLGYDFVYPYRGERIQRVLNDPSLVGHDVAGLSDAGFHLRLQRDTRSNQAHDWFSGVLNVSAYGPPSDDDPADNTTTTGVTTGGNDTLADLSSVPAGVKAFHETIERVGAEDSNGGSARGRRAKALFERISREWDRNMAIGNTLGALFWTWHRLLFAVPRDAIDAQNVNLDKKDEDKSKYWTALSSDFPIYLVKSPSRLMRQQCKAFHPAVTRDEASEGVCGEMAALLWVDVAGDYDESAAVNRWGSHYNQMTTKHLMLDGTILDCLFQRTVPKSGDMSSVDVSDFKLDKKLASSFASSMRQIYDWTSGKTSEMHFALPGGNSGNPFSEFFQNLLLPFENDAYILATAEGDVKGGDVKYRQTLTP